MEQCFVREEGGWPGVRPMRGAQGEGIQKDVHSRHAAARLREQKVGPATIISTASTVGK